VACPLLVTSTGAKFGKTEQGTVWLSAERTSPYAFYQYWIGQDDRDVAMMLRRLTLLPADEIYELEEQQRAAPERRPAQRRLAFEMTARVHGQDEAQRQERVAAAVFSGEALRDAEVLETLYAELDHFEFNDGEIGLAGETAVRGGLYASNSEARRQIQQGGYSINGQRVTSFEDPVPEAIDGRYLVLRAGKKRTVIGRRRA
jgi:tyrosyl-tRNA synthetase